MSGDFQHLSRSQFVLTYGPGAIIETKNGPRLIPSLRNGLGEYHSEHAFERFEIPDVRLCNYIQKKAEVSNSCRIVALPSNAGLGKKGNSRIYSTYYFPRWKVCYGKSGGKKHIPVLYRGSKCPECRSETESGVVRFIVACPDGHLDDVDWHYAVHHHRKCKPEKYLWITGGSSLANIRIRCPICKAETTMEELYRTRFPCTGRTPEKEHVKGGFSPYYTEEIRERNCSKDMRITQRQSTSLRIAETVTLLTIPQFDNTFSRILQQQKVMTTLNSLFPQVKRFKISDDELFIEMVKEGLAENKISDEVQAIIESNIRSMGIQKFQDFYNHLNRQNPTFLELIFEEFESLTSGPKRSDNDNFIMDRDTVIPANPELPFPALRIFPIRRIRTVTVQTGYRRMVGSTEQSEAKKVTTGTRLGQDYWYPGYEGFGEGIFITSGDGSLPEINDRDAVERWNQHDVEKVRGMTDWAEICTKPGFVWLHTFSHALIKAVSEYTGYSAASIRERIYLSSDYTKGGILLYNTSPGEDGGMGGLTGIVNPEVFKLILQRADEILRICSNDPLCFDIRKTDETPNGAACYSCLLISETSCEHRNFWLDRHLIIGGGE